MFMTASTACLLNETDEQFAGSGEQSSDARRAFREEWWEAMIFSRWIGDDEDGLGIWHWKMTSNMPG